jgi:hypothetical protein
METDSFEKTLEQLDSALIDYALGDIGAQKDVRSKILIIHLHIERLINIFLDNWFMNSKKLPRLAFKNKLDLAAASVPMENDLYGNVRQLNVIRNNYAHKLGADKIKINFGSFTTKQDISTLPALGKLEVVALETLRSLNRLFYGNIVARKIIANRHKKTPSTHSE